MAPFFNGFVIIYQDKSNNHIMLPYIAYNVTTNTYSRWRPSIDNLLKAPAISHNIPFISDVTFVVVNSCYLNGEEIPIEQAQQIYPEYFI